MVSAPGSTDNRLEAFLRIVEVANRSLDIGSVLAAGVAELRAQVPCDVVLVLLPDERGATLEVAYSAGMPGLGGGRRPPTFPLEGSVYGDVLRSPRPRVLEDVAQGLDDTPLGGAVPLR